MSTEKKCIDDRKNIFNILFIIIWWIKQNLSVMVFILSVTISFTILSFRDTSKVNPMNQRIEYFQVLVVFCLKNVSCRRYHRCEARLECQTRNIWQIKLRERSHKLLQRIKLTFQIKMTLSWQLDISLTAHVKIPMFRSPVLAITPRFIS